MPSDYQLLRERYGKIYVGSAARSRVVKIGTSLHPRARCYALSREAGVKVTLLAIAPGTMRMERLLHRFFAAERLVGEWFIRTDRIDRMIRILRTQRLRPRHLMIFLAAKPKPPHPHG